MAIGANMARIAFILLVSFSFLYSYDSIDEALKNGITKGDVIFYGDWQHKSANALAASQGYGKNLATYGYLGNMGYLLGSVRLGYTSGFYKNVRASISFASALSFYDHHKDLNIGYSSGHRDSQADFFDGNEASLGESFIEYFDGDTSIKAGRIGINNEWSNMLSDGIWIRNKSFERLLIEGFWVGDSGRIDYFQMTDFRRLNLKNASGVMNLGIKYYFFDELLALKAYSYFAPGVFYAFGSRVSSDYAGERLKFGAQAGITYSFETMLPKNAYEVDLSMYAGWGDLLNFKLGYIRTDKNSGLGSLNIMGDNLAPFFIWGGKAFRIYNDANLFYGMLSSKIKLFNFFITYATTSFSDGKLSSRQNEIDFSTEISVTENIFVLFNLMNTHLDSNILPTLTQINGGIRMKF